MRFEITFNRAGRQRMLPMDYQYYVSAWIYKVLKKADKEFANFLHQQGYGNASKLYKLFCFGRLNFGKPKLWKEKKLFEIANHKIRLPISFDAPEAASNFIKGLFMQQEFYLGDKFNGIDLQVTGVEALPDPNYENIIHYSLITPCVVSYKSTEHKYAQYLMPDHEEFETFLIKHLAEKYRNTKEATVPETDIQFKRNGDYKKSGYLIKRGTNDETRVIGSLFDFSLTAPVEIHQMIRNAGLCEKSSSGFGDLAKFVPGV